MRAMLDWLLPSHSTVPAGTASNQDPAPPQKADPIARLRRAFYDLEDLPDTIGTPTAADALPIDAASVDTVAFAAAAADTEVKLAIRRSNALDTLHRLARKTGAVGTDNAVEAALMKEKR